MSAIVHKWKSFVQNSPGAGGSFPFAEEDSTGSGDNYRGKEWSLNVWTSRSYLWFSCLMFCDLEFRNIYGFFFGFFSGLSSFSFCWCNSIQDVHCQFRNVHTLKSKQYWFKYLLIFLKLPTKVQQTYKRESQFYKITVSR